MTSQDYSSILMIIIAVLPSLVWLFFYLKEDPHPEPRYWLFTIFIMGIGLAPLVIFLEMALTKFTAGYNIDLYSVFNLNLLIVAAAPLVEEAAKYGVVHLTLNKNPVLDEPVDGMIYIITAALGFAAIENVFAIFSFISAGTPGYLNTAINFASLRFISAVALHGLASGIMGYFFAKFYFIKRKVHLIFAGLFFAAIIHGAYNFFITRNDALSLGVTGFILGASTVLVIYLFNRLKHYKTYQQNNIDGEGLDKI